MQSTGGGKKSLGRSATRHGGLSEIECIRGQGDDDARYFENRAGGAALYLRSLISMRAALNSSLLLASGPQHRDNIEIVPAISILKGCLTSISYYIHICSGID